jgi:2-oxoglutarate dehydrogenase E2 component (dihydrolipoamide succinyltransferase)
MATNIKLPPLGDGVNEVTLTRWLKKVGDVIKMNEPLLEVETDKITLEVAAPNSGILQTLLLAEGEKARVGDDLATIMPMESLAEPISSTVTTQISNVQNPSLEQRNSKISPVVSRMLAEHHLDINLILGTGQDGRVTKQDVLAFLEKGAQPAKTGVPEPTQSVSQPTIATQPILTNPTPTPPFQLAEPKLQVTPLTPMRAKIAEHMLRSLQTSAQVTTVFEFDFSAVSAHRAANKVAYEKDGVNLTWLAYLVCVVAKTLRSYPLANSAWSESPLGVALNDEINIGIAVSLGKNGDEGLVVPVIKRADELNLKGVARQIQTLAQRARNKQLQPGDMQGGTFSISNHGNGGSLFGTPVLNQPQCGILGFGAIEKRVKVIATANGDVIAIRPCAYISFTFDHRVLDGAAADHFVAETKRRIEEFKLEE